MALISIDNIRQETLRSLKKSQPEGGVILLSYKRNRSLALIKINANCFRLLENGYLQEENLVSLDQLEKKLKTCIKREFPRSRKVRLVKFTSTAELEKQRQKI